MNDQSKKKQTLTQKKASLDDALEYAESIVNTVHEPLIVLDQDLRVITASQSFYDFFKVKPEETVGRLIYNLGNEQWDIPKLRELLEDILPQKTTFDNYEVEHDFATIGRRIMLLNARQIQRVLGKEKIILLAIEDITEHKRLEDILTESEELYRGVFRTASDGILLLEKHEGKITHINPAAEKMLGYSPEESIGNKLQDIGFMLDMDDFQTTMQELNKNGIINYTDVPVTTKSGQHIDTDIYLVNKTTVVQCNVRDISERKQAEDELKLTLESLRKAVKTTIQVMVSTVEMRDPYTAGHQLRVADLACAIASEMGLAKDKIEGIRMAGSIHDIGKLSIPAEILSKPTKLTNIEFSLIKEHSLSGYEMLKNVESPWPLAKIVYQHHERMNGSGYPRNLKGDEIIMEARIMAVADVVEAMASHRPYRAALGIGAALEEIEKNKGILYDNAVSDACLRLFREKGYQLT
jgi:PAS domain S-box-containing protein/putative nucleotidyltransferase with HDIG domain